MGSAAEVDESSVEHRNEVSIVGRVAADPETRELPSGDELVSFRVVVERPPSPRGSAREGRRAPTVDTLDCSAWTAATRRAALRLACGDVVAVSGSLHRRFWRVAAGAVSRTEVEVGSVRRVRRGAVSPRRATGTATR